jgi:hypothetical protein
VFLVYCDHHFGTGALRLDVRGMAGVRRPTGSGVRHTWVASLAVELARVLKSGRRESVSSTPIHHWCGEVEAKG